MEPALFQAGVDRFFSECHLHEDDMHPKIQVSGEVQGLPNYKSYIFRFWLTPIERTSAQSVNSDVYYASNPYSKEEHVARLTGKILPRSDPNFFRDATNIDLELRPFAHTFFNPTGNASRIRNPQLLKLARESGGFFSIFNVEVEPSHRGRDLGLQLVQQTLIFFRNKWILVVMKPAPLPWHRCLWVVGAPLDYRDRDEPVEELKLRHHFSRFGFEQAGRDFNTSRAMFLTKHKFFPAPGKTIPWVEKREVEGKQFCIVREHNPSGIDKQLQDIFLWNAPPFVVGHRHAFSATDIMEVEVLLSAGASIHRSRALHLVAKQGSDNNLLERLLIRSGNIDAPDESGNGPLHEAASSVSSAIPVLVKFGASKHLRNNNNDTPFDILLHVAVLEQATLNSAEQPVKDIRELTHLRNAVLALLPMKLSDQLIGDCLSPRMHKILVLTAKNAAEAIMHSGPGILQDNRQRKWRKFCAPMSFLPYIPLRVLRRNRGKNNNRFMLGWACIFYTISECLECEQLPSVRRVRQKLIEKMKGEANPFLDGGGKIEFALDATISVTENSFKEKSEYWSYLIHQGNIASLVETPFDDLFNIVTAMCLDGCDIVPHGPYKSSLELLCKID